MELVKNIAAVIGCISAAITLLVMIFKPIRQRIIDGFTSKAQTSKVADDIVNIGKKLDILIDEKEDVIRRLERVEQNVLENEKDRLKSELAQYASMCRRGYKITESDYNHIQEVYEKYHITLHANHTGTDNYATIKKYFEEQNKSVQ